MKPPPAPIRFLLVVVLGWVGFRFAMLAPGWIREDATARRSLPAAGRIARSEPPAAPPLDQTARQRGGSIFASRRSPFGRTAPPAHRFRIPAAPPFLAAMPPLERGPAGIFASPPAGTAHGPNVAPRSHGYPSLSVPVLVPDPASRTASRWTASAWLFLRDGGAGGELAPGGTLGGSQAGARLAYRLIGDVRRPLALSGRLYAPLDRPQGAEAGLGLDWRPLANVPIHILAERRERIGRDGRSDFALTLYGGGERRLLRGRLRLETYGQAGIVGIDQRDLFADGAVRASVPVGPVEIGAGAWGGAQPRATRLDVGPQAGARLPLGRGSLRISAEWRFRVAGDAAPHSGPTLTVATDF